MAKKRKPEASRLDEVDRTMYTSFCSAANSLSQLYSQAVSHQRVSFQAGERQGLEKLYQWIVRQQEEGSTVSTFDIIAYLQNELECGSEEAPMSPGMVLQQQHLQSAMHSANLGPTAQAGPGPGNRWAHSDQQQQPKNSVFSNALSSPVRRSLQPYHLAAHGNGPRSSANDTNNAPMPNESLDMHADSPDRGFNY